MADRPKSGTPFLVFLSLCLSLFAVVVSVLALFIANDQFSLGRKIAGAPEIRTVKWDWESKIARVEKALERARASLLKGDEKSSETAGEQLQVIRGELEAWLKAAEPRFQQTITSMSKQAEQARVAVREKSAEAAEKISALAQSLRAFREKSVSKKAEQPIQTPQPTPAEPKKDEAKK